MNVAAVAPTPELCPFAIAADTLFLSSRQATKLAPRLMIFHLIIRSINLLAD